MRSKTILALCGVVLIGCCVYVAFRSSHPTTQDFSDEWCGTIEKIILRYPNSVFERHIPLVKANAATFITCGFLPTGIEYTEAATNGSKYIGISVSGYWEGKNVPGNSEFSLALGSNDYLCVKVKRIMPEDIAILMRKTQQIIEIRFDVPLSDFIDMYRISGFPPRVDLNIRSAPTWRFVVSSLSYRSLDRANMLVDNTERTQIYWFHSFNTSTLLSTQMNK